MPMQKCSRSNFAKKIREARKLRSQVPADLRPLFNHVLRLAIDSAERGYCQRAGMEIRHAKRLTRFGTKSLGYVAPRGGSPQYTWKRKRR